MLRKVAGVCGSSWCSWSASGCGESGFMVGGGGGCLWSPTARLPYRLPNPLQESNHESDFEQRNAWFTKRHKFDHEKQHQSPIHAYDRPRNARFTKCPLSLKHLLSCITSSPQLHPTHPHSPQYNHHPHKTLHTHPTPSTTPLNSIPNAIPPYDKHTKHNNHPQLHPHKRRAL